MLAIPYDGFWAPMDTLKERSTLERRYFTGDSPWMVWNGTRTHEDNAPMPTMVPGLAPNLFTHP